MVTAKLCDITSQMSSDLTVISRFANGTEALVARNKFSVPDISRIFVGILCL
jgi:hypothetical protein